MNKKKLVELADEVLTDIDAVLQTQIREELEKELSNRLREKFAFANYYLQFHNKKKYKESYDLVKPILDEAIDKLIKWIVGKHGSVLTHLKIKLYIY